MRLRPAHRAWPLVGLLSLGAGAPASEPALLDEHRDWGVYAYHENGRKRCYVATHPVSRRGQTDGWDDSWLLVTDEPESGFRHSVSFTLDRALTPGESVRATIGKRTFDLVAEGDTAWTASERVDLRLVVAMKRGHRMLVSATSADGRRVLDSFSLMGFTSALDDATTRCQGS